MSGISSSDEVKFGEIFQLQIGTSGVLWGTNWNTVQDWNDLLMVASGGSPVINFVFFNPSQICSS